VGAYDVSTGASSEGHVAFNILQRLAPEYRIVLITRRNNREQLLADPAVRVACNGMHIIGFDLPRWASWWKQGGRFYFPYAYLWQLLWPFALLGRRRLRKSIVLTHVLNFHNDSIPTLAWLLGIPVVWGPLNHNEQAPAWRQGFWPWKTRMKRRVGFALRRAAWKVDPWLRLATNKADSILSAGPWVDRRLGIAGSTKLVRLSQLGVASAMFNMAEAPEPPSLHTQSRLLVHAGRLDWIKGLDIAIEALRHLPVEYRLLLVGSGPSEKSLRELVNRLGLQDRVCFKPPVLRTELPGLYASADLFLFPSAEAAGLAWIEALACGLPTAGFAGDTAFALNSNSLPGVYIAHAGCKRDDNIKAYARLILDATSRQHDRNALRESVLRQFDWNIPTRVIANVYESIRNRTE
jgi:glycosyltransferase involved in cell wall biosynthesis